MQRGLSCLTGSEGSQEEHVTAVAVCEMGSFILRRAGRGFNSLYEFWASWEEQLGCNTPCDGCLFQILLPCCPSLFVREGGLGSLKFAG